MHVLGLLLWVPLIGAVIIALLPERNRRLIKGVALVHAAIALLLSWSLPLRVDWSSPAPSLVERLPWPLGAGGASLSVDGLSLPLVLLTTLITVVALVASLKVDKNTKGYFAWFLVLEFAILGVFEAQSVSVFYMFWEVTLVPLFFLISIWGGEERGAASMSFLLYTLGGSVFMLVALIAAYIYTPGHSFDRIEMARACALLPRAVQTALFAGFFLGFAVKIPAFPLHGWLPLTYVEAPTPVSIMLSAVLAKMGGYGLLRAIGLFPMGAEALAPILFVIALLNIVYGALLAFRQTDMKTMIAYSSVSHMGFVLLGAASLNTTGFVGAVMQMVTHGITTGALFLLVGALHERTRSRDMRDYGGLAAKVPLFATLFSLALLASMGLPGLAGFVSELHALAGGFERWSFLVVVASVGVLISAAYSIRAISRLFLGPSDSRWASLSDLRPRELLAVAPLGILMVGLGVAPGALLRLIEVAASAMASAF